LAALAFLTVGLSLKLALFPLHQWLPNAYAYAPSSVSAFIAATATKVSLYALLRFYFSVFGVATVFERLPMQALLMFLALGAIFVASVIAFFQTDLKRLFAYSSVAQIGYIVLGVSLGSVTGLTAAIAHILNHAVTKGALFLLLGGAVVVFGSTALARVQGMGRVMPITSLCIVICGLSLVGVPGTAGFVTKWYLVQAALEQGLWWLVFMIAASSLIAFAYTWRFVEAAYFQSPHSDVSPRAEAPWSLRLPALILVVATVYFGFDTSWSVGRASEAAVALFNRGAL